MVSIDLEVILKDLIYRVACDECKEPFAYHKEWDAVVIWKNSKEDPIMSENEIIKDNYFSQSLVFVHAKCLLKGRGPMIKEEIIMIMMKRNKK